MRQASRKPFFKLPFWPGIRGCRLW